MSSSSPRNTPPSSPVPSTTTTVRTRRRSSSPRHTPAPPRPATPHIISTVALRLKQRRQHWRADITGEAEKRRRCRAAEHRAERRVHVLPQALSSRAQARALDTRFRTQARMSELACSVPRFRRAAPTTSSRQRGPFPCSPCAALLPRNSPWLKTQSPRPIFDELIRPLPTST